MSCLDAELDHRRRRDLVDEVARLDERRFGNGVHDGFAGNPARDAGAQVHHFFVAFVDRLDHDAVGRAAVIIGDDDVLRSVHELVREVARIRRLERGIGQTLASTVGGDEILQHGQTFAEVRRDGLLDDFARGLGHQTAHPRELLELLTVTTCAGINRHEHRVHFLAAIVVFEGAE